MGKETEYGMKTLGKCVLHYSNRKGFALVEGCLLMMFVIGIVAVMFLPASDFLSQLIGVRTANGPLAVICTLCALVLEVLLPWQLRLSGKDSTCAFDDLVRKGDFLQAMLWRLPIVGLFTVVMLYYWTNYPVATVWGMIGAGEVTLLACGLIVATSNVVIRIRYT